MTRYCVPINSVSVTPVTPQKSISSDPENEDNHNNHRGGESKDNNAPIANTFLNDETDVTEKEATAEAEPNQALQPVTPADNQLVTDVTGCNQDLVLEWERISKRVVY